MKNFRRVLVEGMNQDNVYFSGDYEKFDSFKLDIGLDIVSFSLNNSADPYYLVATILDNGSISKYVFHNVLEERLDQKVGKIITGDEDKIYTPYYRPGDFFGIQTPQTFVLEDGCVYVPGGSVGVDFKHDTISVPPYTPYRLAGSRAGRFLEFIHRECGFDKVYEKIGEMKKISLERTV